MPPQAWGWGQYQAPSGEGNATTAEGVGTPVTLADYDRPTGVTKRPGAATGGQRFLFG